MKRLLFLALFAACAYPQGSPIAVTPLQIIDGRNGAAKSCSGCYIYTYSAGTTTPLATYTDSTLGTTLPNPVRTNSGGYAISGSNAITGIWVGLSCYKLVLKDASAVTIWSQDNVCSQEALVLLLLAGPSGSSLIGYNLGVTGSQNTTVQAELRQHYELKADFGARGNGSTDDSSALTAAIQAASTNGYGVHVSPGNYLACTSEPTIPSGKDVVLFGDGPFTSTFKPFGGAVACNNVLKISTTGNVTLHDFGCQYGFTGHTLTASSCINITGPGSAGALSPPNSVTVNHMYFSQAKSVGLQCQPCQNVIYANNISYQNYFFAASFASSGTVGSPLYLHGFSIHDNLSVDESIGVGLSFFVSDISVTGNVFVKSNLSLVQVPHAYATVEGNTWDGVPDVGCYVDSECGSISGSWNPLFFEGVSDWVVGMNHISNINGSAGVFQANGSNVTIGSQLELPTTNGHVDGLVIENSSAGFPLLISAKSNGSNPILGANISIKNVKMSGVNECPNAISIVGLEESNNYCVSAANDSYILNDIQNGTFKNNTCRNCNTAGGTTCATSDMSGDCSGTTLSATNGSATLTGSGTVWSSALIGGGITIAGTTYQILSRASDTSIDLTVPYAGTSVSGLSYSIYYGGGGTKPGLTISGTGTHQLQIDGNTFMSDNGNALSYGIVDATGLTPDVSLIRYDKTNVCRGACAGGIYSPVPTLGPSFSSCGTSPVPATYNTNAQGLIVIGSAGPTSCTMTFANSGFNQTPICTFTPAVNKAITRAAGTSGTAFVFQNGDLSDMSSEVIQYGCVSSAGSVSDGWYPYSTPY